MKATDRPIYDSREEARFYHLVHLGIIASGVLFYVVSLAWLTWRCWTGGGFERVMAPILSVTLLMVMIVNLRGFLAIVFEGDREERRIRERMPAGRVFELESPFDDGGS